MLPIRGPESDYLLGSLDIDIDHRMLEHHGKMARTASGSRRSQSYDPCVEITTGSCKDGAKPIQGQRKRSSCTHRALQSRVCHHSGKDL